MKLKNENKLTDDELEQVVGGSLDPMSEDSKFLNVIAPRGMGTMRKVRCLESRGSH